MSLAAEIPPQKMLAVKLQSNMTICIINKYVFYQAAVDST